MLRSIFSLLQNIIDSDKEYNNKKSGTIYLVTDPADHKINMDLEIDGKCKQMLKSVEEAKTTHSSKYFTITTDQGDTVTCKHSTNNNIRSKLKNQETSEPPKPIIEKSAEEKHVCSYINEEPIIEDEPKDKKGDEQQGDVGMNVKELLASLPQKKTPVLEEDKDELSGLLDQIQKMKKGMERLHQIAKQFTCSETFKQDVDLLLSNLSMDKTNEKSEKELSSPEQ